MECKTEFDSLYFAKTHRTIVQSAMIVQNKKSSLA